jgi:hypothetical protein
MIASPVVIAAAQALAQALADYPSFSQPSIRLEMAVGYFLRVETNRG